MHYELSAAARAAFIGEFGSRPYYIENKNFRPPMDGSEWLKFNYMEGDTLFLSYDRKCKSYLGTVQIGVIFPPGKGVDSARLLAKQIANFFEDGKMLNVGYIYEGAIVHQMIKHDSGWMIPIRFTVRVDTKEN